MIEKNLSDRCDQLSLEVRVFAVAGDIFRMFTFDSFGILFLSSSDIYLVLRYQVSQDRNVRIKVQREKSFGNLCLPAR